MRLSSHVVVKIWHPLDTEGRYNEYTVAPFFKIKDRDFFIVPIEKVAYRRYMEIFGTEGNCVDGYNANIMAALRREVKVEMVSLEKAPEPMVSAIKELPAYKFDW